MENLEKLFEQVINRRGIHNILQMSDSTVRSLRKKHNDGEGVSIKKMREILELAGYKKVQEEMWEAA